jgi:ParB family chromosome partitioning protein
VDLLTGDTPVAAGNDVQMLRVDSIKPFAEHPFHLYEGERLRDMVESIREHGVLVPVIVRQTAGGYEMLAGHNRQNAARLAGMTEIPAIVKKGLSDQDAYVYVIEINVIQRSFSELFPSEKAAVLAMRYEKITCQGRRNDIVEEIARLSGTETSSTCGHDDHKLRSRDSLGEVYGLSGSSVKRLLRVNQLVPEFKSQLDAGELSLVAAVDLSYLTEDEQKRVSERQGIKLEPKTTKVLKDEAAG